MAYTDHATDLTISERIMQNILSTLRGITVSNGFATELGEGRVERAEFAIQVKHDVFVAIVEQFDDISDHLSERIEHTKRVALCVTFKGKNWRTDIKPVLADIRAALLATPQRGTGPSGGNAISTRILNETLFDQPSQVGSAQVDLEILFRTAYLDPTTALN